MLSTGAVVDGRYELRRSLGQGSEGTVYEAVHRFTGQRFAVKIGATPIPAGMDWKRVRLLLEARALGQLRHPNIVAITDAGVTDDFPFVVMELLEGRSLESLLVTRGHFGVADAVAAALQVCDALKVAHSVNVLHRDVKPANVIVVREGDRERVKLVDFGTSKRTHAGAERVTADGAIVGTPAYMAPEQLMAASEVDEGVDVYAVGAMLFECLTGAVPYEGAYPRVLMAVCNNNPPPSVRLVRPQVDDALDQVISRALAKRRSDRFANVGELASALQRACPQVDGLTRLIEAPRAASEPRRKFNRAAYRTPVRVIGHYGEIDGRCEDISEGGMLLLTDQPCQVNEEVSVRFALPIEGKITVCKARVQWVRARPDRPQTARAIGLELLDASNEVRASIARYVGLMTGALAEPAIPAPAKAAAIIPPTTQRSPIIHRSAQMPAGKMTVPGTPAALARAAGR